MTPEDLITCSSSNPIYTRDLHINGWKVETLKSHKNQKYTVRL
uniref:Uncharacterized protein n=1 Tax=Rhizophora mucronata TaxID=61149 RepID=A0A2P2PI08_RHIMU